MPKRCNATNLKLIKILLEKFRLNFLIALTYQNMNYNSKCYTLKFFELVCYIITASGNLIFKLIQ